MRRIDLEQGRLSRKAQDEQRFAVAQHVGEELRLVVNQVEQVRVLQQGPDLVHAGDEGSVVAQDQLLFEHAVEHVARSAHNREGDAGKQGSKLGCQRARFHRSASQR